MPAVDSSHRPRLELLEQRVVLSPTIFTVDSTGSGASGSGTSGTLPYVVSQASANPSTDCSEIKFDSSVFLGSATGEVAGLKNNGTAAQARPTAIGRAQALARHRGSCRS